MKALSLDHVAGRKPLGYGDYRDATKPLRRMLKQLGAGSMEAGLRCLAHDDHGHAEEVAKIVGVAPQVGDSPRSVRPAPRSAPQREGVC